MRKSKFVLAMIAAMMVSGAAFAGEHGNAANGKTIFTQGKGNAPACGSCHGENAEGNDGMGAPRLSNLGQAYTVKQLTDLAADKRTPQGAGAVMPMFAKELSEQDRRDVAAYLDSFDPKKVDKSNLKELGVPNEAVSKGKEIVMYGRADGKVPACQSCHGFNGRGAAPVYPVIGQQRYVYLTNQLKAWRAGAVDAKDPNGRANDPMGQMRAVAKNMTDDEITYVAAFLSQAPRTTMGNSRVPDNH